MPTIRVDQNTYDKIVELAGKLQQKLGMLVSLTQMTYIIVREYIAFVIEGEGGLPYED